MNLIDMHCDTLWKMIDLDKKGNLLHNDCAVSLSKLKEAGSIAQFFACFVYLHALPGVTAEEKYDAVFRHVLEMAEYLKKEVGACPEKMVFLKERAALAGMQRAEAEA